MRDERQSKSPYQWLGLMSLAACCPAIIFVSAGHSAAPFFMVWIGAVSDINGWTNAPFVLMPLIGLLFAGLALFIRSGSAMAVLLLASAIVSCCVTVNVLCIFWPDSPGMARAMLLSAVPALACQILLIFRASGQLRLTGAKSRSSTPVSAVEPVGRSHKIWVFSWAVLATILAIFCIDLTITRNVQYSTSAGIPLSCWQWTGIDGCWAQSALVADLVVWGLVSIMSGVAIERYSSALPRGFVADKPALDAEGRD